MNKQKQSPWRSFLSSILNLVKETNPWTLYIQKTQSKQYHKCLCLPDKLPDSSFKNLSLSNCKLRTTCTFFFFPLLHFNKSSCIVDICLENRAEFLQEIDPMVMILSGNCSCSESPNYSYAVLNVSLFCSVFTCIALIQLVAYNVIFCLYQLIDS